MKVNEIFESIQGEGRFVGEPALFIRLSGCTRNCLWCDSKYHKDFKEINIKEIVKIIKKSKKKYVIWTGGEPLLQLDDIKKIKILTSIKSHHLETNGDLITSEIIPELDVFDYICISPKDSSKDWGLVKLALIEMIPADVDIKVVTDLDKEGMENIKYSTILMPLTTNRKDLDDNIKQRLWHFCVANNKKFSLRQHVEVWGCKKGI